MRSSTQILKPVIILLGLMLVLPASACGSSESKPVDEIIQEGVPGEDGERAEISGSFEEIPLPDGFPGDFPLPDDSRIGSSGQDPEEGSFQIVLSFGSSLEEALGYFRQNLPTNGWIIEHDESFDQGHGMTISSPEYYGDLIFMVVEEEAYIDVSLDPQGSMPDISDVSENLGTSADLGESETDFPVDFPLPTGVEPIPVPEKLAAEGYQLAFSYPDMPELAYIQFSAALASQGWMIGEFQIGTASYTMPFENPATGFQGYALLTSDPAAAGVNSITGCIVVLHPGSYP